MSILNQFLRKFICFLRKYQKMSIFVHYPTIFEQTNPYNQKNLNENCISASMPPLTLSQKKKKKINENNFTINILFPRAVNAIRTSSLYFFFFLYISIGNQYSQSFMFFNHTSHIPMVNNCLTCFHVK